MAMNFELSAEDIQLFLEECDELLEQLEQDLLALEREDGSGGALDRVFRVAHTLKGSAATLGHKPMAEFTHHMEDLLSKLRTGELAMSRDIGDALLASLDVLQEYRDEIESGESRDVDATELLATLARLGGAGAAPVATAPPPASDLAPAARAEAARAAAATTFAPGFPLQVQPEDLEHLAIGQIVWQVGLQLDPNGLMPAVRAFQALIAAESWGEIIRSEPSRAAIEDEQVGETIFMLVAGAGQASGMREAIEGIPELQITTFEPAPLDNGAGSSAPGAVTAGETRSIVQEQEQAEAHVQALLNGAGLAAAPSAAPARAAPSGSGRGGNTGRTVRVAVELLDNLMNLVGELVIDRTRLTRLVTDLESDAGEVAAALGQTSGHIGRVTTDLQEEIMRARMLPVENLFRKFPRMVRDLAHAQGKEVELIVRGEDTELDRSIMEEIADPLLHLLRNAVDHAIETPEERVAAGKDPTGRVWLEASHEEGSIMITVRDDGRGMDRARIGAKALERGLVTEEQLRRMDDQGVLELILQPGFSLAEKITDVSGRGVGMDVVRSNIERINGTVTLASSLGAGSEVRIRLPLTLAIIQALLVRIGGETYALPLSAVLEAAMVDRQTVRAVQNQELISLRGEVIPLVHMRRLYGLAGAEPEVPAEMPVVIVATGNRQAGLVVDSLEGEQEIVVKNLGPLGQVTPGLAGATILGDGSVSLILDVASLLPSHRNKEELDHGYHLAG